MIYVNGLAGAETIYFSHLIEIPSESDSGTQMFACACRFRENSICKGNSLSFHSLVDKLRDGGCLSDSMW